jgi:voltage-gated potassium channel
MKFISPQVIAILQQRDMRMNLRALLKQVLILVGFVALYSVLFHVLMLIEGQEHTWMTGLYWTLTVMSTLGFGDITFHTDLGRIFSLVVLLTGLLLLLIVLPFAFIRYFYAPWIEAQIRFKAPRSVGPETEGHVIICNYDAVAEALIPRLTAQGFDYVLIEPDPAVALSYHSAGLKVVMGEPDAIETWQAVRAERAAFVVANLSDTSNTIITLTLREHAPDVPIAAWVDDIDAMDILELSGANHAIALQRRLGQHLAAHAGTGVMHAHRVGNIDTLVIAEFSVRRTDLAGHTIRQSGLRESTGLNVVAVWEHGQFIPAQPDFVLSNDTVVVVVGTEEQLVGLDDVIVVAEPTDDPILLIGGGRVGQAAARALKEQGLTVHVVERDETLRSALEEVADHVVIGNAASLEVMKEAGIERAPSVLLTTRDDATNIFLTIYSRRLNPDCHIVSRVTHERNLAAMHRAGANFVLSESSLGAKLLLSVLQNRELIVLGEDEDIFITPLPASLENVSLAQSGIGHKTGLIVIGTQREGVTLGAPPATAPLEAGTHLLLLGTRTERQEFRRHFES